MKFRLVLGVMVVAVVLAIPSTGQAQFFADDFDSYANGSGIIGQGGWEGWDGTPAGGATDSTVSNVQSFSSPNSLFTAGGSPSMDVVQQFSGVNSGTWYAKTQVYIPSAMSGDLFFIVLNTYNHGGPYNWSVQMVFCATNCGAQGLPGFVVNLGGTDFPGGETLPLVLDDWAELVVEVDLSANSYNAYYDGTQFVFGAGWQSTGVNEIQCFDLFGESNDDGYFDNIWLDQNIPVDLMNFDIE
jgi:hypothetical protein